MDNSIKEKATEYCRQLRDTLNAIGQTVDMGDVIDAFVQGYTLAREEFQNKLKQMLYNK